MIKKLLTKQKISKKYSLRDTVELILETENINKKEVYQLCLNLKNEKVFSIFLILILVSCSKVGRFGTGVDVTFDPRTIGMYIDDKIMEKNLSARLILADKKYFFVNSIKY